MVAGNDNYKEHWYLCVLTGGCKQRAKQRSFCEVFTALAGYFLSHDKRNRLYRDREALHRRLLSQSLFPFCFFAQLCFLPNGQMENQALNHPGGWTFSLESHWLLFPRQLLAVGAKCLFHSMYFIFPDFSFLEFRAVKCLRFFFFFLEGGIRLLKSPFDFTEFDVDVSSSCSDHSIFCHVSSLSFIAAAYLPFLSFYLLTSPLISHQRRRSE